MAKGEDITTKFKVDISDLKKGITDANNQIKLANSEFKKASSGMDDWSRSSDGVNAKLKQLKSVLEAQNSKLQAYQQQLQKAKQYQQESADKVTQLKSALEKAKQEYGENSTEVKQLEQQLSKAEQEYQKMSTQVTKLETTMNNQEAAVNSTKREIEDLTSELGRVEKAEQEASKTGKDVNQVLKEMDDSANEAGDGFTVLKGAIANLVADGIRMAIDAIKDFARETLEVGKNFDSSMSQVAAVSGASADELDKLRTKAKEMGADTKFSATEAADAFNYMAMAGWKTEDMLSGIDGILALAAAGNTDLATTSDIVTDALTAFGYKASDAGRMADVMAAASSNANTNIEMMGATFKYVAPIAGAMGYSMEDTSVAIGLMANAGIKGEQAGTALRSIMTRLASPPKEAAGAMEKLGISITNADGTMRPFSEVMQILREKFDGLSEAEQAQMAKALGGQEAMSGLLAIVNAAPADFDKLTQAINNSDGAAEEMSRIMQDNLGGDMTELGSKIEGLQIALYEQFEPALRVVVQALQKLADGFTWCIQNIPGFVPVITGLATAFGVLAGALAIQALIGLVTKAFATLTATMLANPIVLVVAAIAGLVTAFVMLWNKSEAFRNFWIGLWESIKSASEPVIEAIKSGWNGIINFFSTTVPKAFNDFKTTFMNIWNSVSQTVSTVWDAIVTNVKWAIDVIVLVVKAAFTLITLPWMFIWMNCKDKVIEIWEAIKNAISTAFNVVKDKITEILTAIKNKWNEIWTAVSTKISEIWNKIKSTVTNAINAVKTTVTTVFNEVKTKVTSIWNNIKSAIEKPINDAKSKVSSTVNGIKSTVSSVFSSIKSKTSSTWNEIKNAIEKPINNAKKTVTDTVNKIKETAKNIFNGIKPKLNLSLPHVTVNGGVAPWGIGGKGRLPSFSVTWNRLGGVFDSPTIFGGSKGFQGLGEDGAEAVVPLERNKYWIKSVAKDMMEALADEKQRLIGSLTGGNTSNVNNFTQVINAPKTPSRIELYRDAKNLLALKGV